MNIYIKILLVLFLVSCNSNKSQFRYQINTETMQPGINPGDYVIEDTSIKEFTYGDIVAYFFLTEGGSSRDIFRVVGLPNDSISIEKGVCIINGRKNKHVPIKYSLIEEELPNRMKINIRFYIPDDEITIKPIKIPKDHYYIMGDFRGISHDSRIFGPVHKDKISGKIIEVIK